MTSMTRFFSCWALVLGVAVGSAFAQDSMQLIDGRFVIGAKMTATDDGVVVHFKNGDVLVRDALVKTSTVMGVERAGASWDGVSGLRPFSRFAKTTTVGVY